MANACTYSTNNSIYELVILIITFCIVIYRKRDLNAMLLYGLRTLLQKNSLICLNNMSTTQTSQERKQTWDHSGQLITIAHFEKAWYTFTSVVTSINAMVAYLLARMHKCYLSLCLAYCVPKISKNVYFIWWNKVLVLICFELRIELILSDLNLENITEYKKPS